MKIRRECSRFGELQSVRFPPCQRRDQALVSFVTLKCGSISGLYDVGTRFLVLHLSPFQRHDRPSFPPSVLTAEAVTSEGKVSRRVVSRCN